MLVPVIPLVATPRARVVRWAAVGVVRLRLQSRTAPVTAPVMRSGSFGARHLCRRPPASVSGGARVLCRSVASAERRTVRHHTIREGRDNLCDSLFQNKGHQVGARIVAVLRLFHRPAIHAHGHPVAVEDQTAARAIIDELVSRFESDETGNWSTARLSEKRMVGQMKGIITFEMPIERLEIKQKMSQNRSEQDAAGVIDALSKSGRESDRATADMMSQIDRSKV